ncbi:MAG: PIG-L family deacetylase, partial [Muribaculaceae bacterium]|nr:PIG-L family deacetylase [Muribaculaceae bacterium]
MNRREMLKMSGLAAAGATILGLPAAAASQNDMPRRRGKVLVIGAHPDDPETTSGGTICLLTDAGHEVVCVYLTRGQAGIEGKSHSEAAAIRSAEAEAACEVMGARAVFMSQIDGNTEANLDRYREMREL